MVSVNRRSFLWKSRKEKKIPLFRSSHTKEHISGLEIVAGGRRGERRYKHIVFLPRGLMESLCADDKYAAELLASDGSRPH